MAVTSSLVQQQDLIPSDDANLSCSFWSTSDGELVHLFLGVWVSTTADIATQASQYMNEVAGADDACDLR